jgi:hypothetical protein
MCKQVFNSLQIAAKESFAFFYTVVIHNLILHCLILKEKDMITHYYFYVHIETVLFIQYLLLGVSCKNKKHAVNKKNLENSDTCEALTTTK